MCVMRDLPAKMPGCPINSEVSASSTLSSVCVRDPTSLGSAKCKAS